MPSILQSRSRSRGLTLHRGLGAFLALGLASACGRPPVSPPPVPAAQTLHNVIPAPVTVDVRPGAGFLVDTTIRIVTEASATAEVAAIAEYLARLLGPSGTPIFRSGTVGIQGSDSARRTIHLALRPGDGSGGDETYELVVTADRVQLTAETAAGLFYGVQTLRQLLPVSVEHPAALARVLRLPEVRIADAPRFEWRGAMLDVSRHFLPVMAVKRFINLMALYKLNRLHLHLSDDQGWRVEIKSWPNLATYGGSTQVGGGAGGFYSQAEYSEIVAYAQSRYITIIPEFDMPGHTNAALASYPILNCDSVAPPLYTGIRVGFSALCAGKDTVYTFVNDVVREISALTPGAFFHIGGDEVEKLSQDEYRSFIERVQQIVSSHGKRMIGWGEIAPANLSRETVVQHWKRDSSVLHAARGGKVILSPSARVYIDQKYDSSTILGLRWAALVEVRTAYDWDPGLQIAGVPEAALLGVEAPLWSETLIQPTDFEFMAFPRLAAVAEVGWSPQALRSWADFRQRLGAHGPRLAALGVNFYRSPQIPWTPQ